MKKYYKGERLSKPKSEIKKREISDWDKLLSFSWCKPSNIVEVEIIKNEDGSYKFCERNKNK